MQGLAAAVVGEAEPVQPAPLVTQGDVLVHGRGDLGEYLCHRQPPLIGRTHVRGIEVLARQLVRITEPTRAYPHVAVVQGQHAEFFPLRKPAQTGLGHLLHRGVDQVGPQGQVQEELLRLPPLGQHVARVERAAHDAALLDADDPVEDVAHQLIAALAGLGVVGDLGGVELRHVGFVLDLVVVAVGHDVAALVRAEQVGYGGDSQVRVAH